MAKIKETEFCALASDQRWLSWLSGIRPDLYQQLYDHLRSAPTCKANRLKMKSILSALQARHSAELVQFLESTVPHVLDGHTLVARPSDDKYGIFEFYDPEMLTLPRRQVLSGSGDLGIVAKVWGRDKAYFEFLVHSDRVYIEYLPIEFASFKDKIPAGNWVLRGHRGYVVG